MNFKEKLQNNYEPLSDKGISSIVHSVLYDLEKISISYKNAIIVIYSEKEKYSYLNCANISDIYVYMHDSKYGEIDKYGKLHLKKYKNYEKFIFIDITETSFKVKEVINHLKGYFLNEELLKTDDIKQLIVIDEMRFKGNLEYYIELEW